MRVFLKGVGALAIVLVSFFGTLFLLEYSAPLCPQGTTVDLKAPFSKVGSGFAYFVTVPALEDRADSGATPTRSTFLVCENGYRLGPPHSIHADIATMGKGRFSHWTSGFIFSASDNSDPNTNGRRYWSVPGIR
jgi:pectate lyase